MATLGGPRRIPGADTTRLPAATVPSLALVAHQGGWDEILFVAVPIAIIIGLLAFARTRIRQLPHHQASGDQVHDATGSVDAGPDDAGVSR